jgi:thioesterase domain-containing protein/acyl carrier protein
LARDSESGKQLVGYYRMRGSQAEELAVPELRAYLQSVLPTYMVPTAFVSVPSIPLTPNGKVDRRALERLQVSVRSSRAYEAARTPIEQALVQIWAEVLSVPVEKIGIHDDFFELGGHSLLAVQLMAKITRRLQRLLPLSALFTASCVAALAELIDTPSSLSTDPILVPIQPSGSLLPIFAIPGAGGNVLSLQPLSKALGPEQPFYGLQAVGLDGHTPPLSSVEQTARANLAALKSVQPHGPYRLLGHSYGGVIAYEMARMLLEQHEQIDSLTLLDSRAPSVMRGTLPEDELGGLIDACTALTAMQGKALRLDADRLRDIDRDMRYSHLASLLAEQGFDVHEQQLAIFSAVFAAQMHCYQTYTPAALPRPTDVCLFRATREPQQGIAASRDYEWTPLLVSSLKVCDVAAEHYSMLDGKHAAAIAAILRRPQKRLELEGIC